MISINEKSRVLLQSIGARLREARLERNESQALFAERLGVCRYTLQKMENGDPNVAIGVWLMAAEILHRLDTLSGFMRAERNLFDEIELRKKTGRQRASRTRNAE